jgi:5-methylcytosine-specific restriction endonuclease McrA
MRGAVVPLGSLEAAHPSLVILAATHRDHDPTNNRISNLAALCQRCHLIHDRPEHRRRRRLTFLRRKAVGDLFLGPYP